jgi:long-subunit fatty acid transport protein
MGDTVLEIHGTGHHFGWNAGLFVDRWKYFQLGASYADNGDFHAEGEGSVTVPQWLGGGSPPALITFDAPLPPVINVWANSQVTEKLMIGAGWEYQMWNACCGDHEGDILIGITSEDGDALGEDEEDGITGLTVATEQYAPRRLWNASNFMASAGYQANDWLWLGGKGGYHQNAVPDYAVSATNIDYQSVGFQLAARAKVAKPLTVGVSYAKYFLFERTITNSAWDVRDESDPAYRDEFFSPKNPYKASTNGVYSAKADMVGLRVDMKF